MTVLPEPREIRRLPRAPFTRPMGRGEAIALEERFESNTAPRLPAPGPVILDTVTTVNNAVVSYAPAVRSVVRARLRRLLVPVVLADLRRSLAVDEFHAHILRGARGKAIRLERKRLNIRIRKQRRLLRELAQPSNGGPR